MFLSFKYKLIRYRKPIDKTQGYDIYCKYTYIFLYSK